MGQLEDRNTAIQLAVLLHFNVLRLTNNAIIRCYCMAVASAACIVVSERACNYFSSTQ